MKAAIFHEFGGPDVVRIEDVATPEPGAGEVRVRVRAAALNHLDLWVRRRLPIETPMPHIGGADVAGEVEACGPGVDPALAGRRVAVNPSLWCGECEWCRRGEHPLCVSYRILGEHTQGGFAEYVVVPARNLFPLPADVPYERAAAGTLAYLTAWRALATRARLQPGETVLVTGASGGVATAAIQIAKLQAATVYAVTTSEHVERVRALGADVVYDRTQVDFSKEVWRDTRKRGVDVIVDSVGSATWAGIFRAAAKGGRIVIYGATTGPEATMDLRALFWKQCDIMGTTMSTQAEFEAVLSLVCKRELDPVIDVVLPLDQARAAHERLEAGEHFGKIVLVP